MAQKISQKIAQMIFMPLNCLPVVVCRSHAGDGAALLLALLLVHYHVRRLPHAPDLIRFHAHAGRLEHRDKEHFYRVSQLLVDLQVGLTLIWEFRPAA